MTTHDNLAQTPYFHNFESAEENENWVMVNGEAVNKWHINTLDNNSDSVLFVSYDGSNANYYGFNTVVWAYRDIILMKLLNMNFPSIGDVMESIYMII